MERLFLGGKYHMQWRECSHWTYRVPDGTFYLAQRFWTGKQLVEVMVIHGRMASLEDRELVLMAYAAREA